MTQSKSDFYKSLPAKRMGAGILFFNLQKEFLIVQPSYKDTWEIPGGIVELNESPRQAALREVSEELGLAINPATLSLMCVEYMFEGVEKTEALMFIFSGGMLTDSQIAEIKLEEAELKSYRFVSPSSGIELLGSVLGARIKRCIEAESCFYSEGKY